MGKPLGRVNSIPQIAFGPGFLQDHLGRIIDDPQTATMELIANSYDAGASKVDVRWPALPGDQLSISDNGTGMTREELETRWRTFSYDRIQSQGPLVKFPSDVNLNKRVAFGHNGKGRFSPFCFADEYQIETRRDGKRRAAGCSNACLGHTDTRALVEPAISEAGIDAQNDAVLRAVGEEIRQIEAEWNVAAVTSTDKAAIGENQNISEGAVEFNPDAAANIAHGNIECATVPPHTGFGIAPPQRLIAVQARRIIPAPRVVVNERKFYCPVVGIRTNRQSESLKSAFANPNSPVFVKSA